MYMKRGFSFYSFVPNRQKTRSVQLRQSIIVATLINRIPSYVEDDRLITNA